VRRGVPGQIVLESTKQGCVRFGGKRKKKENDWKGKWFRSFARKVTKLEKIKKFGSFEAEGGSRKAKKF